MKIYQSFFYLKIEGKAMIRNRYNYQFLEFQFSEVTFSIYLNRHAFVMSPSFSAPGRLCFLRVAFSRYLHLHFLVFDDL